MPLKNATIGMLALLGGVVGGALSGGIFGAVRSAEAGPRGGGSSLPLPPNPNEPRPRPPIGINPEFIPAVITVPIGGLLFKSWDGKVLARMHTHPGGALFSMYNDAGLVVASFGVDEEIRGGRFTLCTPTGEGTMIGLGVVGGARLDLYTPSEPSPRASLRSEAFAHVGTLTLRDIRPLGLALLPNDLLRLHDLFNR